ncbi:MAG: glycosyltransferase family 2 protein [Bernardetiaceae bacterium]
MSVPAISVLMATYNTPLSLVQRAVKSVLSQDIQDFELLVIDDGSQITNSCALLRYLSAHEDQVSYLRHQNTGQAAAINGAIPYCRGQYVTIIDADDAYKPNHLSACLRAIEGADLIASTTEIIAEKETDYYVPDRHDPRRLVHIDDCIAFATLFGKKEIFVETRFKNMYAADAHFYERVSKRYKVKKLNLRTYIYYRNIPNSICRQVQAQHTR